MWTTIWEGNLYTLAQIAGMLISAEIVSTLDWIFR